MKSRVLNDLRVGRLRLARPTPEGQPAVIRQARAACAQIVTAREKFPELGSGRGQRRFLFTSPGRERDLRRLEAIALVLHSLITHMDLVTMRAGRRRRDGSCDAIRTGRPRARIGRPSVRPPCSGGGQPWSIEEETGISIWRVERALRDLRAAGYITSHQPRRDYRDEDGDQKWRSYPAVHAVSKLCLSRLGIDLEWLRRQAAEAERRAKEGPEPLLDVRLVRARQRLVRQQRIAARRATAPDERAAAAAIERLRARIERKQE